MITTTHVKQTFACDGVATEFVLTMPFIQTSDIKVYLHDTVNDTLTLLTEGPDYSISSPTLTYENGGTVTTVLTYSADYEIVAERHLTIKQLVNYIEGDDFPAETHEGALDKLTMIVQELDERKVDGPAASDDEHIAIFDGTDGNAIKQSAHTEDDLDDFRTHVDGDGSDHADVALNNAHRLGDGSDHANVALADAHRLGDGSDHADVATNTADILSHRTASPADHPDKSVTLAKMADMAGNRLLGKDGVAGTPAAIPYADVALRTLEVSSPDTLTDDSFLGFLRVNLPSDNAWNRITWANIKATLKTYLDTLYEATGNLFTHQTTSPIDHPDSSVTFGKMQDIATSTFMGRSSPGLGAPEEVDKTAALAILNVEDGADVTDTDTVGGSINTADEKLAPIAADKVPLIDTEDSDILKWVTFSTAIDLVKAYFDTIYAAIVHTHAATDITSANLNVARMPTGGNWTLTTILSILGKAVEVVKGISTNVLSSLDTDAYYIYFSATPINEVFEYGGLGELSTDGGGNWIINAGGSRKWYQTSDASKVLAWQTAVPTGSWRIVNIGTTDAEHDSALSNGLTPPAWSTPNIPSSPTYTNGTYVKKYNYLHILPSYAYTVLQQVEALNPDEYISINGVSIGPSSYDPSQIQANLLGRHMGMTILSNADSYTLAEEDSGKFILQTKVSVNTVTVPLNATIPIATNRQYHICQTGAGAVTITAAAGVTINGQTAKSALVWAQYGVVTLVKIDTNTWVAFGAIGVFA